MGKARPIKWAKRPSQKLVDAAREAGARPGTDLDKAFFDIICGNPPRDPMRRVVRVPGGIAWAVWDITQGRWIIQP